MIACNNGVKLGGNRIKPDYDKRSGRLETLRYDSNGDRRVDMTSTMDGARVDEDTDGDGKPDKWETCDGDRLAMVAYDTLHRGTADRRLIYGADGRAQLEVDAKGNGTWTPR